MFRSQIEKVNRMIRIIDEFNNLESMEVVNSPKEIVLGYPIMVNREKAISSYFEKAKKIQAKITGIYAGFYTPRKNGGNN